MNRMIFLMAAILGVLAISVEPAFQNPSPILLHRGSTGAEVYYLPELPGEANCYAVVDPTTRLAAVVDPAGRNGRTMADFLKNQGVRITHVLITHAHSDHVAGLDDFLRKTLAVVVISRIEMQHLPDRLRLSDSPGIGTSSQRWLFRTDEQHVEIGRLRFKTLLIPGHSLASLSYELSGEDLVFTGDTLFRGTIGRTDMPDSAGNACLVAYIKTRLLSMDDRTMILPGHGPASTIGRERFTNSFLSDPRHRHDPDSEVDDTLALPDRESTNPD